MQRGALLSLRSLVDDMRKRYRELERLTGVPIAVHRALACIHASPGLAASQLAVQLGVRRPAVSQMLRSLISHGWVERLRTPQDQRAIQLFLTPAGRAIVDATGGRAVGTLQRAVNHLSLRELAALSLGMEALLRELPPTQIDTAAPVSPASSAPTGRARTRAGASHRS